MAQARGSHLSFLRKGWNVDKRKIGSLEVSVVGLGTNNFGTDYFGTTCDQAMSTKIVDTALECGINFIDTAEEYSTTTHIGTGHSEEFLGVALGSRRNEVVIASKFSPRVQDAPDERGAKRIVRAVEGSLRRLRTDRIDLLQQHQPDPETPIEEILEALTRLVKDGKVREVGCSNFTAEMIDAAEAASAASGSARFVSVQNPYNLLDQAPQQPVLEACQRDGLMLLPCFPLASGVLTGKYRRGEPAPAETRFGADTWVVNYLKPQLADERLARAEQLEAYARGRGHSLLDLAMSWLACQPLVASVIAGATRPEQVRANVAAAGWTLSDEDFGAVAGSGVTP